MKLIKGFLLSAMLFVLAACGGNASYSPEKCAELKAKIESKQTFSESDYDEMLDQMNAMLKVYEEKQKSFGDDAEKQKEFAQSVEGKEIASNFLGFIFYLDSHKEDLKPGNLKKLMELQQQLEKMN